MSAAAAKAGSAAAATAKAPNPFFRSKKLDLGCYVNIKVIRDHTKRKAFAEFETQRYCASYYKYLPISKRSITARKKRC